MDGLARAAAAPVTIVVEDGELKGSWTMSGMEVDDYAVIEQEFLKERRSPMELIEDHIANIKNPAVRRQMLKIAYADLKKGPGEHRIPVADMVEYLDSVQGIFRTALICFRKHHPDMTEDFCRKLVEHVGAQEMRRRRDQASGVDWRGNSTGSGSGATPDQSASPEPSPTPGDASTGTSPRSTAGPPGSSAS